jgi:fluoride exporter
MTWTAIAIGGALGSLARHAVNHVTHATWLTTRFPAGIVIVNISGCFVIGLLAGLIATERLHVPLHWREFVFVGVLGGYTTFSTFGLDTFLLSRTHSLGLAALNVGSQVVGGLSAVWIGYYLAGVGR